MILLLLLLQVNEDESIVVAGYLASRGVTSYLNTAQLNCSASTIVVRNYSPPLTGA